jgi:hypothetical protein
MSGRQSLEDDKYNYARDEYLMTKTTPTPDVMDDVDCTAVPLQIPALKTMTMTVTISALKYRSL